MTKRILLSCIVVGLMIPVCAFAAGTSDTTTETATVDEAKSPQYGGTFTYYGFANNDPPSPDIADGQYFATRWIAPIAEKILVGGIETYGPMGTDEYGFRAVSYIPDAYLEGKLIESWEITPDKVYWHVRQGIHWAADNVDFMENREMTGEDVALDLISFWKSAWGGRFDGMIADVRTEGKYTVVIEFENYSHNFMYFAGYEDRAYVTPPEVLENNPEKWGNQVGTGAWMFEEWVVGSHMSYVRNPNYWDSTTIDGVEYYAGYVYYDNLGTDNSEATVVNSTVAQLLFVNMANGMTSGTNWPVMEKADGLIHANMQTVAAGMMNSDPTSEMVNMELFSPNGLKNAEVLQGGSTTPEDADWFWMAPRFYILDANAATWLLFWKTDNLYPKTTALHINYYDDEEDASSGNITITNEFTIIDVEGKIPTDICLTYPKQGWIDINWDTRGSTAAAALIRQQSILGFSYLKATGSASESWTALTPIARQVDDD